MLRNLSALLTQAETSATERKFDVEVLLSGRLAPDQFNFTRQVQICCDTAKLGAARLIGKEQGAPSFDDSERTVQELQQRIEATISYLESLASGEFADASARRITQPRWQGKTLSGAQFFEQHVLPNFYFHMVTAYSILRHHGVQVGKKNYLGAMPYQE